MHEPLNEYGKDDICMNICKWCDNYRNFGGVSYSSGVAKYYEDWRCNRGLTPREYRCPRHEDYMTETDYENLEGFRDDSNY